MLKSVSISDTDTDFYSDAYSYANRNTYSDANSYESLPNRGGYSL